MINKDTTKDVLFELALEKQVGLRSLKESGYTIESLEVKALIDLYNRDILEVVKIAKEQLGEKELGKVLGEMREKFNHHMVEIFGLI